MMELSSSALDSLLDWLDADREQAGAKLIRIREKLTAFFEWRQCSYSEERADETIQRVARKVSEGEQIRTDEPQRYFYGVARLIALESYKESERRSAALRDYAILEQGRRRGRPDPRSSCMKGCLNSLSEEQRELLIEYYDGGPKIAERRRIAGQMEIPAAALRLRVFRLKERVRECVTDCLAQNS